MLHAARASVPLPKEMSLQWRKLRVVDPNATTKETSVTSYHWTHQKEIALRSLRRIERKREHPRSRDSSSLLFTKPLVNVLLSSIGLADLKGDFAEKTDKVACAKGHWRSLSVGISHKESRDGKYCFPPRAHQTILRGLKDRVVH